MGNDRQHYKIVSMLLAMLLAPLGATAADAPLSPLALNARYNIAWSGITLGRININASESDALYSMVLDTKTRGIGSLISDERSVILANGTKTGPDRYIPIRYESRPPSDMQGSVTQLTYNAQGNIANRTRVPDDDPAWRPPLTFAQIDTARDPITAGFMLRREAYAALAANSHEVAVKTYDGARLAEMKFTRAANARVEVMGAYVDCINLVVNRTPIAGYTPKELKKYKKGDPEIHLYFTDDEKFLPVRATAATGLGELSMTLVNNRP